MKNSDTPRPQMGSGGKSSEAFLISWADRKAFGEEKLRPYLKELHKYFLGGGKTSESISQKVNPVSLKSDFKSDNPFLEFPVYYNPVDDKLIPLYQVLEKILDKYFDEESLNIIYNYLPNLFHKLFNNKEDSNEISAVEVLANKLAELLPTLDLPMEEAEDFDLRIKNIKDDILVLRKPIYPCSGKTAFDLLNLQLKQRNDLSAEFLKTIKKVTTGLQELKLLESNASGASIGKLDFASDFISFDKIEEVAIDAVSSHLSKSRLSRLNSALQSLSKAQETYSQNSTKIIVSSKVAQSFDLAHIFTDATINVSSGNTCLEASGQLGKEIEDFVETIAALRIGELMITQKYDEDLHDNYFNGFDLAHVTKDDLNYFPLTIVIEESRLLMRQSREFLALLSDNSFVKILGINQLKDLFKLEDQEDPNHLDLASLAIFRRNSYVFQGGIDRLSDLKESYTKGLDFPGAAFWNVLLTYPEIDSNNTAVFSMRAAIESRFFPRIDYSANGSTFLNTQVRLDQNPAPDSSMPGFSQQIKFEQGIESRVYQLSLADFLAFDPELRASLEFIPPAYQSPNFVLLQEYLSLPLNQLSGKIPVIWMVNDQNEILQAAVPISWVQQCRNRLEYWGFLQSLAGINNTHLQATVEKLKSTWEEEKKQEIKALKTVLNEQFEKEKMGILEEGVVNILTGLINQENNIESVLTEISHGEFQAAGQVNKEQISTVAEKAPEEEEVVTKVITEEAWVESEECTSCRDCIDALPSVFKYNENKQAYVHNPKGGTFAEIVKAAEKCPARCIIPGLPQDKTEKALDKWIERAAKFN